MGRKKSTRPTSPRKIAANRANAQKSTGPEDTRHTRYNARRSGLFSTILTLTPEDRKAFASLRNGVLADLRPEGELLHGLADQIVVLHWRLRQCVLLEQHAVADQQALQGGAGGLTPPAARPGYHELQERRRLLQEVRDAAERLVDPPPGLREHSSQVLGAAFTRALFDWQPPNLTAMWMCEEMFAKSKNWFHKETPSELIEGTNMVRGRTPAEIDADAEREIEELRASHSSLCYEMSQKLVALKQEQLAQIAEQAEAEARWAELTGKKDRLDSYGQHHAGWRGSWSGPKCTISNCAPSCRARAGPEAVESAKTNPIAALFSLVLSLADAPGGHAGFGDSGNELRASRCGLRQGPDVSG